MTTNNDLNQQRAVSSNAGASVTKNLPTSPNVANRNPNGTGATSPSNNIGERNKEHKNPNPLN